MNASADVRLTTRSSLFDFIHAGVETTKRQLPNLIKIALPYILISAVVGLALPEAPISSDTNVMQSQEYQESLKNAAIVYGLLLFLVVLPFSAYTAFITLRYASQDPLPKSQTVGSLWRFESGFFAYVGLLFCQTLTAIVFNLPGVLVASAVKPLLSSLPASAIEFCAEIPVLFTQSVWGCFVVISSTIFFKTPQERIKTGMRRGMKAVFAHFPFWCRLGLAGFAAGAVLQSFVKVLNATLGSTSFVGVLVSYVATLVVYLPILFIYRAGYQAVNSDRPSPMTT